MQQQKPLEGAQLVIMTIALSLATFMQVLDSTIANVAIPTIAGNLGSSLSQGTWVSTSFGVANAAINIATPNDQIKIGLYVKNLFNEHYVAGLRRISGSVGGAGAVAQALPRDFDRYFGATVAYKF